MIVDALRALSADVNSGDVVRMKRAFPSFDQASPKELYACEFDLTPQKPTAYCYLADRDRPGRGSIERVVDLRLNAAGIQSAQLSAGPRQ